jgi:hypothetical protein
VFRDGRWKIWAALLAAVLAAGTALYRLHAIFGSSPPGWLHLSEHRSQAIPDMHELNSAWQKFHSLLQTIQTNAQARRLNDYAIHFIEIERNGTDAILWSGETVRNHGFELRPKIETMLWGDASGVLGFYTSDGDPLAFTTYKNSPANSPMLSAIVHLDKPLAPGAAQFLIYRQRYRNLAQANPGGQRTIGLGFLKPEPTRIDACGIRLPPRATLVRCFPESEATVLTKSPVTVTWLSTDLHTTNGTPIWIAFTTGSTKQTRP